MRPYHNYCLHLITDKHPRTVSATSDNFIGIQPLLLFATVLLVVQTRANRFIYKRVKKIYSQVAILENSELTIDQAIPLISKP